MISQNDFHCVCVCTNDFSATHYILYMCVCVLHLRGGLGRFFFFFNLIAQVLFTFLLLRSSDPPPPPRADRSVLRFASSKQSLA